MSHTLSPSPAGSRHLTAQRLLLWAVLLVFAFFFLLPLYVMVSTSLKSMDEVRSGTLLSVPLSPSLDAWSKAWHSACTGTDCGGLKPFFMNSVLMVIPAVTATWPTKLNQPVNQDQAAALRLASLADQ